MLQLFLNICKINIIYLQGYKPVKKQDTGKNKSTDTFFTDLSSEKQSQ